MIRRGVRRYAIVPALLSLAVTPALRADGVPGCPALFTDLTGVATFYDADGSGACSFDTAVDLMVTAVAAPDWAGSLHCGRCLEVWGPEATIVVRVVDLCPECPSGHLDLSAEAFDVIADPVQGVVPIAFRSIPCPVAGPLAVRQKEGSNPWWLALQMRDHRHAVASVEVRENGSSTWQSLGRESYNYFVVTSSAGGGLGLPIDLRVTDVHGHVVTEADLIGGVTPGAVTLGTTQFPACAGIFLDGFEGGTLAPLWSGATP
jgi:expansin (peptidoglycan-binding protein)